ncbi:MAG: hypothetical protein HY246_23675 [Proteobacteria bacterium]|nr:hypothetical protein [Pseudomonadota bacterium]
MNDVATAGNEDRRDAALRALAIVVGLALLLLVFRPAAHVYDMPLTEDGYYSLTVARNLAAGHSLTIDGTTLTNGFQPLFTLVEALAFVLGHGDEILAMRLVMAFSWLFHLLGALCVGLIARDAWPAAAGGRERRLRLWLAVFLYLAAPLLLNHAYNGLETGCVLFFYALAWRWVQSGRDRDWLGLAAFGLIIGLLVLTRIDAAFLALVLGLNELRRSWRGGLVYTLARGATLGGTAFLVSAPWWIYNAVYFGSPMPTSGAAQQEWALEWLRFEFAEWALRIVAMPWLFAGAHETVIAVDIPWPLGPAGYMTVSATGTVRFLLLLAGAVWAWRVFRGGRFGAELAAATPEIAAQARRSCEFAACLALALVGLVAFYVLSFVAYWFYYRYLAPAALFAFVVVPIVGARLLATATSPAVRSGLLGLAAVLVAHIVVLVLLARNGTGLGGNTVYHDQVALVRAHVPDADYVAAGQSGTLGFFRARVVNMDGKVNRAALAYQDHMWVYLRQHGIRWFADWPYYAEKYLGPSPAANGWRFVAERNYFHLYEYVGTDAKPQ